MDNNNANIVQFQPVSKLPYPLKINSGAHYQENINKICGPFGKKGYYGINHLALLFLEDDNLKDSSAVRVEINGLTIGYFSPLTAQVYWQRINDLCIPSAIGSCKASIRIKRNGTETDFEVRLAIDLINLKIQPESIRFELTCQDTDPLHFQSDKYVNKGESPNKLKLILRKLKNPKVREALTIAMIGLVLICVIYLSIWAASNSPTIGNRMTATAHAITMTPDDW
jgi:hypothetical protein